MRDNMCLASVVYVDTWELKLHHFTRKSPNMIFNQLVDVSYLTRLIHLMTAQLDQTFQALADPTRRQILAMLLEDDMAVTDVAEPFAVSLAAISKHLGVLTAAKLISQEKRGRVKWCKLEPDALREASVWMQAFGQMDAIDLDAFEAFLNQELKS
jgi:DNA-binding transcriptional ArsR family regulator